jgi:hypothetical protein
MSPCDKTGYLGFIPDQRGYGKDFAAYMMKESNVSYKKLDVLHNEEVIYDVCCPSII